MFRCSAAGVRIWKCHKQRNPQTNLKKASKEEEYQVEEGRKVPDQNASEEKAATEEKQWVFQKIQHIKIQSSDVKYVCG